MNEFKTLKKLIRLPLVVTLLQSCTGCTSVVDSGSDLIGIGYASDTTAILFYELWETTESFNIPVRSNVTSYYGWELKLVDVRFHNVYWEAQVEQGRSNTAILYSSQWNDSSMLVDLTGSGYWLWTVGNKKPQKVNFNWNTEMKDDVNGGDYKNGWLLGRGRGFQLRPWKNDSVLLYSKTRQAIIDSQTMTVNDWSPTSENIWVNACDDFWWGKNGGVCLLDKSDYVAFFSEKGDTLGNFTYTQERVTIYGSQWANDRMPSFWIFGKREFLDSLRNITEY
ncbi:MAG: hypothetical protein LBQ76_09150 [Candidatus Fibromonas sp.]|jgi:hypothetical protein|nr:hypothetical protein [Candidatus Fibromonas sp.]